MLAPLFDLFGAVLLEEVGRAVRRRPVGERLDRVGFTGFPYLPATLSATSNTALMSMPLTLPVLDAVGVELGREVGHAGGALDQVPIVLVVFDNEQAGAGRFLPQSPARLAAAKAPSLIAPSPR